MRTLPRILLRGLRRPPSRAQRAARDRRAGAASAPATAAAFASGIRQLTPSTQKSRLPCASVHTTAAPGRHRLQRRQREALVYGGLDEHGRFAEQLVDLLVAGRVDVAHAGLRELGLDPEQAQLGARLGQRAPRGERQRQVLQRVGAPEREHHVLAAGDIRDAGGSSPGRCPAESAQRRGRARAGARGSTRRSSCSETRADRSRSPRGARARGRGSRRSRCPARSTPGSPRGMLARHTGAAVIHQVATLIASTSASASPSTS